MGRRQDAEGHQRAPRGPEPLSRCRRAVAALLAEAVREVAPDGLVVRAALLDEAPAAAAWDLASPVALRIPGLHARRRREVAALIAERIAARTPFVARAEVAGPGFVNVWWSDAAWSAVVADAVAGPSADPSGGAGPSADPSGGAGPSADPSGAAGPSADPSGGAAAVPVPLADPCRPPEWRRACERARGLERMRERERPDAPPGGVCLERIPGEEAGRLVRQMLRHLEALQVTATEALARRPALLQRADDLARITNHLYEAHLLLRWPPEAVATVCGVMRAVALTLESLAEAGREGNSSARGNASCSRRRAGLPWRGPEEGPRREDS